MSTDRFDNLDGQIAPPNTGDFAADGAGTASGEVADGAASGKGAEGAAQSSVAEPFSAESAAGAAAAAAAAGDGSGEPLSGKIAADSAALAGGADSSEFTADEADIRFDPSKEQPQNTGDRVDSVKKRKKAKWYFLIPLALLLLIAFVFVGWRLKPKTALNVAVLDQTVLSVEDDNDIDIGSSYRKHQGLFWLLEQQRYVFEDGNFYNTKTDYFGPLLDDVGKIKSYRNLSELDYQPDLMYVSDVYGATDDSYGYFDGSAAKGSGVSVDDMSVISYAYENGATVVAEMELFNSNLDSSVYSQLTSLCGVSPTGWVGRYIYDLQDFTDVPDWAPPMYEKQEGVEWQFSGPGILLVSADKIIVLEQKTDFESKNLLKIRINDDFKKEFGSCSKNVNFYNWFEIVEPNSSTEVLASFEFDVNATGMEKLKGVLRTPTFAAAMRKKVEGKAPVYYFAGDFNDYVSRENYNRFLFADTVYRWISYDRQGDISNFYWNFYNPLMKKILSEIEPRPKDKSQSGETLVSRVSDDGFQIKDGGKWKRVTLNAVSVNGHEPGEKELSRNYTFYQTLVDEAVKMGANCIYAKEILPPEFYRAVSANNSQAGSKKLYIMQNIDVADLDEKAAKSRLEAALKALSGSGTLELSDGSSATYFVDMSDCLIAVAASSDSVHGDYTYSGEYASGSGEQGFAAMLFDAVQSYAQKQYERFIPVGVFSDAQAVKGSGFEADGAYSLQSVISDKECRQHYSFTAVGLDSIGTAISARADVFAGESDAYSAAFERLQSASGGRLVVTGVGASSANGFAERGGVTEKEQAQRTIALLTSADDAGALAAVAADLNDDWTAVSDELYPFTVPLDNNCLWHNTADPAQTTGFISYDVSTPEKSGINLADDDRVQMMSLSSNEGYFYISAQLLTEIDYSTEQLFIGLDTYQRNDGEYYYSKDYTPTALSGMEYVIRFDGKQEASLYVTSSYARSKDGYATKESYSGDYTLVSKLGYGSFSSGDNQFYQTGSTIHIRLPWSWLNVTDPSQRVVINNSGELSGQAKTVSTDGAIVSVLIADKGTGDQLYLFPETKQEASYKTFKWSTWEKVSYTVREKDGFALMEKYFSGK